MNEPIAVAPSALAMLAGAGKLGRLFHGAVVAGAACQQAKSLYDTWQANRAYSIRISSRDDLYADVSRWLLDQLPAGERRSLVAVTGPAGQGAISGPEGHDGPARPTVRYLYDGRRTATIWIDGHPITVLIDRGEEAAASKSYREPEDKIVFVARSADGQAAVVSALDRIAASRVEAPGSRVYIATSWGGWTRTRSIAQREPSTVVLAAGQMERLGADLDRFLASEALYARIGSPWHRGYLLHGPPGTGKTSAALALAFSRKLDIYYLPLADVASDTTLIQLVASVRDRSILLIEDVDIAHAAKSRDDGQEGLSLQGLLNALDGAVTPHGLVTVMTTNDRAKLDAALVRRGRCDVTEEVGYLTDVQLARLVAVTTGRRCMLPLLGGRRLAASEVSEIVKRHIDDLDRAREAIVSYLRRDA